MPNARAHMTTAVMGDLLYAIGGFCSSGYLNNVERFNTAQNVWETLLPMNVRRANAGAGVLDKEIYVLGGQNNNGDHLQSVEVYNTVTAKWTMVRSLMD